MVSMSSIVLGVVGFPLEEQSLRLTIISTLIGTTLPTCMIVFCSRRERGKFKVFCGALDCRVHGFPAGSP